MVGSRVGLGEESSRVFRLRVVTYDFVEFLELCDPEWPVRYEVRRRALDGVSQLYEVRLSGVSHGGHVVEYREEAVFRVYVDDDKLREWLQQWRETVEKLGARPGRYEYA